jgi:hypothetical protein
MRCALLAAIAILVFPAAAPAATVGVEPDASGGLGRVLYRADTGEANEVAAVITGREWRFTDAAALVVAGSGCMQVDPHSATCAPTTPFGEYVAHIALGDADDRLAIGTGPIGGGSSPTASADGQRGDDVIVAGSRVSASLSGGEGNDQLSIVETESGGSLISLDGGPGADRLIGGRSDDRLDGGAGPDRLDGGAGADTVSYARRSRGVVVDLASRGPAGEPGEGDTVIDVESVVGGRGDDRLAGDSGPNLLAGGPGGDRLSGRAGDDWLDPGSGQDLLGCGSGDDAVTWSSATEYVPPSCESVSSGDRSYDPYPRRVAAGSVTYDIVCPIVVDIDLHPCRGTARLTGAAAPHRLLGARTIPPRKWGWGGGKSALVIPLTAAGRRLAARSRGVRAVVRIHFARRSDAEPAVDLAWTIRLKVPG